MFKVGQKVVVLRDSANMVSPNTVVTVAWVDNDPCRFKDTNGLYFSTLWDSLQIVEEPSSNFKVGDEVEIRRGNKDNVLGIYFAPEMKEFEGKVYTVTKVKENNRYILDGTKDWVWDESWLKKIEPIACRKVTTSDWLNEMYKEATNPFVFFDEFRLVSKPKKGIMSVLNDIPKQIKKLLDKPTKAMYQLSWIDSDLEMTAKGQKQMTEILWEEYKTKVGEAALKEVERIKKEEAKDKE